MPRYTSPDGMFVVPAGGDDSIALAQAMKAKKIEAEGREGDFWADWSDSDEAQFQADMARIDAQIADERRVARALAGGIEPTLKGQPRSSSSQSSSITSNL